MAILTVSRSLTLSCFFFVACSASLLSVHKSCLADAKGQISCQFTKADLLLDTTNRQACSSTDYGCLCLKAVKYNAEIRARHGLGPVSIGTESMLRNAVDNSKHMTGGSFDHQDLGKVTNEIQCNVFCSGENIAKFSGPSSDPAQKCMDMWEKSPGHLENILRKNDITVIGIYQQDGWTYCTQTFGLNGYGKGSKTGSSCSSVTSTSSASSSAGSSQSQTSEATPQVPPPSPFPESPAPSASPHVPAGKPALPHARTPPHDANGNDWKWFRSWYSNRSD